MKILTVSDHESKYLWEFFDREKFSDTDLVISCGDLDKEYLSFLVTMISAPLYYVPGNHDISFAAAPPLGCDPIDGDLVIYQGLRIGGLGGSHMYSSEDYQYTYSQMKARTRKLERKIKKAGGIDILVSHAPACGIGDGNDLCHMGFPSFNYILDKYSPKYFIHGHQHMNYGNNVKRLTKYKDTTIINAYEYYLFDY
jgi:uncharacterized protein